MPVPQWFAVQVTPQHEQKVALQLGVKEQEYFLPMIQSRRHWSDRLKILDRPLFPGYVFCRTSRPFFGCVLGTLGVIRIVSFGGRPYPVSDDEISALRSVIKFGRDLRTVPYISIGDKVQIASGPLAGIAGLITRINNQTRVVISVSLIMKSVSIEAAISEVVPLEIAS